MLREFREFALQGNVLEIGVGLIIGAAFGKVVSSLVNDVLMPPIGLLVGNVDFSNLSSASRVRPTPPLRKPRRPARRRSITACS